MGLILALMGFSPPARAAYEFKGESAANPFMRRKMRCEANEALL
jgi:hypothetical protein